MSCNIRRIDWKKKLLEVMEMFYIFIRVVVTMHMGIRKNATICILKS